MKNKVLKFLFDQGKGISFKQLQRVFKADPCDFFILLERLEADELIERNSGYHLTTKGSAIIEERVYKKRALILRLIGVISSFLFSILMHLWK